MSFFEMASVPDLFNSYIIPIYNISHKKTALSKLF